MSRISVFTVFIMVILLAGVSCGVRQEPSFQPPVKDGAVQRASPAADALTSATSPMGSDYRVLERDLHTINLVNGLYLNEGQLKALLPLVREGDQMSRELNELMSENYGEIRKVMKEIRVHLMDDTSVTPQQQERLDRYSMPIYKKIGDNREKMRELIRKTRAILNPNQLAIIESYEPCIVPQHDASNPEKIGGAAGQGKILEILEDARELSDEEYEEFKQEVLEKERIVMRVFNTPQQITSVLNQMEIAMDKARTMSDTEFHLQANELSRIEMPQSGRPKGINMTDEFIEKYLLNPFMTEIIQHNLKKLKGEELH